VTYGLIRDLKQNVELKEKNKKTQEREKHNKQWLLPTPRTPGKQGGA